jgi:hypothetical protein
MKKKEGGGTEMKEEMKEGTQKPLNERRKDRRRNK